MISFKLNECPFAFDFILVLTSCRQRWICQKSPRNYLPAAYFPMKIYSLAIFSHFFADFYRFSWFSARLQTYSKSNSRPTRVQSSEKMQLNEFTVRWMNFKCDRFHIPRIPLCWNKCFVTNWRTTSNGGSDRLGYLYFGISRFFVAQFVDNIT